MSTRALWTCTTMVHDWYSWEFPTRFLEHAVRAGIVGTVESITPSMTSKPQEIRIDDLDNIGPHLRELALRKHDIYFIAAQGTLSSPFEINILIAPFDPNRGRVDGYSIMSIAFDATPFLDAAGSSRLVEHFSAMHSADDTESAFIHLRDDSYQLMYGAYRNPVTYSPMFDGIHWANFLGPGQLEQFNQEKIDTMGAWMTRRVDRGIFIITGPELGQAAEPASHEEMFRLTEIFRNARKPRTPAV